MITTQISHTKLEPSIYSRGLVYSEKQEKEYTEFTYFPQSVVVIFYYYSHHRRAYILSENNYGVFSTVKLPGVNKKTAVIAELRGHGIDRLKNTLYNLEKIGNLTFYVFSPVFFLRIAGLIEVRKNNKIYLELLFNEFRERANLIRNNYV